MLLSQKSASASVNDRRTCGLTLQDAQRVLVLSKVPEPADVAAAFKARDFEAFFEQVFNTNDAHGPWGRVASESGPGMGGQQSGQCLTEANDGYCLLP